MQTNVSNYPIPSITLSTFLKGKVKEKGLSCLIDVLEKVNHEDFDSTTIHLDLGSKIREGVSQSIDITTMLLQFPHLSSMDQDEIVMCHLNMKMAVQRCENVYSAGNCEEIKWSDVVSPNLTLKDPSIKSSSDANIPYVSRRCPLGYKRNGCCKCFKECQKQNSSEETLGDKDVHNYCLKEKSYESDIIRDWTQ